MPHRAAIEGAADGLRAGQIWLQTSTVGVDAIPELAAVAQEYGLRLIDAPVMGTRQLHGGDAR
ncbi:NAD(P)-binding domain-containing protein [Nocardia sp. NBC_00511]|uniref:NAD(P)-binding domain-containing protein n=1 Tax=Nocardia sp. NBC_00511 TaxID=2903591 RepID=UPI0030E41F4C